MFPRGNSCIAPLDHQTADFQIALERKKGTRNSTMKGDADGRVCNVPEGAKDSSMAEFVEKL